MYEEYRSCLIIAAAGVLLIVLGLGHFVSGFS